MEIVRKAVQGNVSGMTEMFYILIVITMMIIHMYTFVKIHQTVLSRAQHLILCKLDLDKEKT